MEPNLIYIIDTEVFSFLQQTPVSSRSVEGQKNPLLVLAIAILGFDDNIGQIIEQYYPPDSLDKISLRQISSIGFPETNSFTEEGELTYIFNIRKRNISSSIKCISIQDQQFLYCYTHFIQRKNNSVKRGYTQKSLVLVSEVYCPNQLIPLLKQLADLYHQNNYASFTSDTLSLLYTKYNKSSDDDNNKDTTSFPLTLSIDKTLTQFHQVPINSLFENLSLYYICKIASLWELIITETPLIIFADNPSICSNVVMLLSSLSYPLEYSGDIRPYFSIYDNDFKDYRDNKDLMQSNTPILGVINPICYHSFSNCLVIHFDDYYYNEIHKTNPTKKIQYKTYKDITKNKKNFVLKTKPKMKFALVPNESLIKSFYDFFEENTMTEINKLNIYLRMYLIELNNDFMRTFETYLFKVKNEEIKKLSFLKENFSIYEIFDPIAFIAYLNKCECYFDKKYIKNMKKTCDLYSRFIKTKCFNGYLKKLLNRIKSLNKDTNEEIEDH